MIKKLNGVSMMNESSILENNLNSIDEEAILKRIKRKLYLVTKRIFDICFSTIGLILLSPLFVVISLLIKKEDKGKAFHIQKRIGKDGKLFKFYKFRSMVSNADEILEEMLKDPKLKKEYKKNMKFSNDPRITKIGKFIRKTSIDELPQLINVLKGNMSLIGNRPYLPRERKDMGDYYNEIIKTKPGITGYWQTRGRSKLTFQDRLELESYYSQNMNFLLDIKIFFLTFYVVFIGRGAE